MRKTVILLVTAIVFVGLLLFAASPLGRLAVAVVYSSVFERAAPAIAQGVVTTDPTDRA